MEEALKTITEDQLKELRKIANDSDIETFFDILNSQFGDGEVLNFTHIKNIFQKGSLENSLDMLGIYVDTYRMFKLLRQNENQLLLCDTIEEVNKLHDDLSKQFKVELENTQKDLYLKAVEPFKKLTKQFENIEVELIATADELKEEGSVMNHCIATYVFIVMNKKYIGFRVKNNVNNERLTLGCMRDGDKLIFNQLKGWGNRPASKKSCEMIIDYCNANKILIQEMPYDLRFAIL